MADYGARIADKAVWSINKKLRKVYEQAYKELMKKLKTFQKRFQASQKVMKGKLDRGQISQAAYESWLRGQVFTGQRWKNKVAQAINIIRRTNKKAHEIIQRFRIHVFAENYNHNAYETEIKTGTSFDIYNEDAVQRLIRETPKMLPEWKIDEEKDYIWNRQKVENSITQGIMQGESVDQIAQRLAKDLSSTNMNKMRMFARTAMTGAQNAGKQKQMEDAEKRGIKVKKQWLATLDDRTRDTHQDLDGQTVPVSESFHVRQFSIRYPGDPDADPQMVYNCRCTMKSVISGTENFGRERRAYRVKNGIRESYTVKNMTYKEWKKWKEVRGE